MKRSLIILFIFLSFLCSLPLAHAQENYYNKTIGGNIYGSIQLVDPLPVVDLGIGGGMFFDYRFNQRFSIMIESFFTTQDGRGRSSGEGSIEFLAIPATTFKIYILNNSQKLEPYFGLGIAFYALTEGDISNNTGGFGLGAQGELGVEFNVAENLMLGVGGTFRSVGLITSLSSNANATTFMPFTMFGRIGYRF